MGSETGEEVAITGYVMEQMGTWNEGRTCILGCSLETARLGGHGQGTDQNCWSRTTGTPSWGQPGSRLELLAPSYPDCAGPRD